MIIKYDFLYPHCNEYRRLHIYLPPEYETSRERYPVMYFFDGHNLYFNEDATYGKSWGLKEFLDTWGKHMIIVGMECSHTGNQRLWEYLPYPGETERFGQLQNWGEETLRWIVEDIKPMIDRDYRTIPFRECTGIGGSSMGGLMALRAVIGWNRWFSKAACVSSAIGFCPTAVLKDVMETKVDPDTRVYLSWGEKESHMKEGVNMSEQWNSAVAGRLRDQGAAAMYHCQPQGGHCEADWEKLVPDFMDFLWLQP